MGAVHDLFPNILRHATAAGPRNEHSWKACRQSFDLFDQWHVLAALAMPDHLHAIVAPQLDREASVGDFSKWFKRWFNHAYQPRRREWQWQEGCFDRLLRSDESLSDKWQYIRQNPVRAGFVNSPEQWPYQFASNCDDAKLYFLRNADLTGGV